MNILRGKAIRCLASLLALTMAGPCPGQSWAVDWPQFGFLPSGGRNNPSETILNPATVRHLKLRFVFNVAGAVGAPLVAGGVAFFGAGDGNVYALDATKGSFLWKASGTAPAVANGMVYVFCGYYVCALDAKTGNNVWAYATGNSSWPPVVTQYEVYTTNGDAAGPDLFELNASNGFLYLETRIWQSPYLSWPAVSGGTVYVGAAGTSTNYLLSVDGSGYVAWSYAIGNFVASSPAVVNNTVYAGCADKNIYAVNANSGALVWKYSASAPLETSPAVAKGVVYIGSSDGTLYALNGGNGTLLGQVALGNFVGSPAVANGVLYISSCAANACTMNALNAETGALLWHYSGDTRSSRSVTFSDPIVVNGFLYFGSTDGSLYAFSVP